MGRTKDKDKEKEKKKKKDKGKDKARKEKEHAKEKSRKHKSERKHSIEDSDDDTYRHHSPLSSEFTRSQSQASESGNETGKKHENYNLTIPINRGIQAR